MSHISISDNIVITEVLFSALASCIVLHHDVTYEEMAHESSINC